jgi:hypothetical protein
MTDKPTSLTRHDEIRRIIFENPKEAAKRFIELSDSADAAEARAAAAEKALKQASFCLRELLPDNPDAQLTVRMIDAALAKEARLMSNFREVTKAEFDEFMRTYQRRLDVDVIGYFEPPLRAYHDFQIGEGWDAVVAAVRLNESYPKDGTPPYRWEPNTYHILTRLLVAPPAPSTEAE